LALAERAQPLDDAIDRALDLVGGDRAFPQREHHAAHQLVAVEVGAAAVLLHQPRHLQVDALIGSEALGALHALSAAADRVRLEARPGVDDLGVVRAAERAFHAYTGKRAQSALTACATRSRLASSAGRSRTSATRCASSSACGLPKPRVVMAGEPMRTPLVTAGFSGSLGMAFLFTVMCARPSAASASLPVMPLLRKSTRNMWQSVRPETILNPRSIRTAAIVRAFSRTFF